MKPRRSRYDENSSIPTYQSSSQPLVKRNERGEVTDVHAPTITVPCSTDQPMVVNINIDIDARTQNYTQVENHVNTDLRVALGDSVLGMIGKIFD